jgi:membrane-associated phospholipid phosphatase
VIAYIARLYVNLIEPGLMILAAIIGLAFIFYLFILIRGGDPKKSLPGQVVNLTFISTMKMLKFIGQASLKFLTVLLKTTVLIFATMRDFFKSKI